MTFEEAMSAMRNGKTVHRASPNEDGFFYIRNGILLVQDGEITTKMPDLTGEEIMATDWEIVTQDGEA